MIRSIKFLGVAVLSLLLGRPELSSSATMPAGTDEPQVVRKTFTYKEVGDTMIQADVYLARQPQQKRPAVVWIHGGALIMGSRQSVPRELLDLCRTEGYVLVSIDYRLAPEVKLPAIIDDVKDAFRWLRWEGPKLFNIDPDRIVVSGGSAGGYLTMMTGICIEPRPKALVAYWGYGDVDGDWYAKPSEFYRSNVPLVPEPEARAAVGAKVLTETLPNVPDQKARGRYYHFLRQNGLWPKEVVGFDSATERRQFHPYCPIRNITSQYPPILMVHGTVDTDVPYEQSAAMAKELARHKVPHELITVSGAGHGLSGGDKKLVADAHQRVAGFIREQLK